MPFGQDVILDASNTTIINSDEKDKLYNGLTWQWLCPINFDCNYIETSKPRIVIKNSDLANFRNFDYMTKYAFFVRVKTFKQVPEDTPFVQTQVNVTWLGEPKSVNILLNA